MTGPVSGRIGTERKNRAKGKGNSMQKYLRALMIACVAVLAAFFLPQTASAEEGKEVSVDNGIPVVYLTIDESEVTVDDMIASPDHSVYCSGKIRIEVPKGFHYSDF